jgi:hypothetical protein
LLRTIFKHLDAGRANTADGELEVKRKTIHLLLGEKENFPPTHGQSASAFAEPAFGKSCNLCYCALTQKRYNHHQ